MNSPSDTDPALRALLQRLVESWGLDETCLRGDVPRFIDETIAALAAAEAAPLDVETVRTLVECIDRLRIEAVAPTVVTDWRAFARESLALKKAREYAALRSPDTETAGEAG